MTQNVILTCQKLNFNLYQFRLKMTKCLRKLFLGNSGSLMGSNTDRNTVEMHPVRKLDFHQQWDENAGVM